MRDRDTLPALLDLIQTAASPSRELDARIGWIAEPRRYGGAYDGYWLSPPREPHLRAEDARGLRLGIYWHVWTAFLDPKLVWC